jgi:hypothetical protein
MRKESEMKKVFALSMTVLMTLTGTASLAAANGNPPPPPPQMVQVQPRAGVSPLQATVGAVVGAVLIGGGSFLLTNRRKGSSAHAHANESQAPYFYYTTPANGGES